MIGIVYIPPRESCHTVEDDIFDTLESEFAKYSTSCHVMYCGDFNSRTGSKDDFIENPNCSNNPNLTIKSRINRDVVSNTHGENMLDLCKNTGLRICNGRLGEDCDKGDYTFYCRRGRSVVD